MPTLEAFQAAAQTASRNDQLVLSNDGSRVTTRSWRVTRWIGNFRHAGNQQANFQFIQALRGRYGGKVTHHVVDANDLVRSVQRGRPLLARQVMQIVQQAERGAIDPPASPPPRRAEPSTRAPAPPRRSAELERAMQESLDNGYVHRFILSGDPDCPDPLPNWMFLSNVTSFNQLMAHLHRQFPKLCKLTPLNLSQQCATSDKEPFTWACYDSSCAALQFTNPHSVRWYSALKRETSAGTFTNKLFRYEDILIHEYAHHLSLGPDSNPTQWHGGLVSVLQEHGFISEQHGIDVSNPEDPQFALQVQNRVREMGLGSYAATNAREFAAEVLAWRMTPGYGEPEGNPRMPAFLENWVDEYFPFFKGDQESAQGSE